MARGGNSFLHVPTIILSFRFFLLHFPCSGTVKKAMDLS
jgi:hypothetical protein